MKEILNKPLPPTLFRFIWYISIICFLALFIQNKSILNFVNPATLVIISLISVPVGGISYLIYIANSRKKLIPIVELIIALLIVTIVPINVLGSNVAKITHDGTRTGPRVSYSSYCNPKGGYVIYENEKIPFTPEEGGEEVLWTKDDIECYKNRNTEVLGKSYSSTTTNTQKVTQGVQIECWGPDGKSFITTQIECDAFNAAWEKSKPAAVVQQQPTQNSQPAYTYVPKQYFHCVLFNPWNGKTYTYDYLYETEEQCVAEQRRMTKSVNDYLDSLPPTSTPAPAIDYVAQCKSNVNSIYKAKEQNCYSFAMGASQACIEINRQDWNAALAACN